MKVRQLEQLLADFRSRGDTASDQHRQLSDAPIVRHIRRLLSNSRQQALTDEDWHALEDTMAELQPEFLERLQEFYSFSTQELRICLLLRLGLQPAAIAQLTNRAKQTITSSRSRLFQKVFGQKGNPEQWDEFILSL
jgi:DNA-binding NarL/FixJ family response regulator